MVVGALVVLAAADWWRTYRLFRLLAADPDFVAQPWKEMLDNQAVLQGLARGRMAQQWAARQAMRSSDPMCRLLAAWSLCSQDDAPAEAGRIVVDEAMTDIASGPPANPVEARALAARFVTMQLALKQANNHVVNPLLAVAVDHTRHPAQRQLAVAALGLIGDQRARRPLLTMLRANPGDVRVQLYTAMAALHVGEATDDLRRAALSDPNTAYRHVAAQAYRRLTGRPVSGSTSRPTSRPTTQPR